MSDELMGAKEIAHALTGIAFAIEKSQLRAEEGDNLIAEAIGLVAEAVNTMTAEICELKQVIIDQHEQDVDAPERV